MDCGSKLGMVLRKVLHSSKNNFRLYTTRTYDKYKPPWKVLFFGTDNFAVASLKALHHLHKTQNTLQKLEVVTSFKSQRNPVKQFAQQAELVTHNWPLENIDYTFDVGLVVSFGYLIPENVINSFPLGMLNVHASLLPRWRGAAPIVHAIANGDPITGVTIMQIKPNKFDVGEIVYQEEVVIPEGAILPELYNYLANLGANVLVQSLHGLPENLYAARPQPKEGVTHAPRIDSSFAAINWEIMPATRIYNLERALFGLYPLSTTWNDIPVKLQGIQVCYKPNQLRIDTPGFIIYDKHEKVIKVLCADGGWISVERVGVYRKRQMSADDFYNGYLTKQFHCRVFR